MHCQILPDTDWKAEDQRVYWVRTSVGNNNDDDNQRGDIVGCSKRGPTERELRIETQRRSQPSSRRIIMVQRKMSNSFESTMEGKCVAGPVLTRAQANMSDKIHPIQVKEAMSSVNKSTTDLEDLQKKDFSMRKML